MGDDADSGTFTFISERGKSVIDYVFRCKELFPMVCNFRIHDFQSFSSHASVHVGFTAGHSPVLAATGYKGMPGC